MKNIPTFTSRLCQQILQQVEFASEGLDHTLYIESIHLGMDVYTCLVKSVTCIMPHDAVTLFGYPYKITKDGYRVDIICREGLERYQNSPAATLGKYIVSFTMKDDCEL